MSLSPRQSRFVEEYVVDLHAGRAAVRAGYSANTAAQAGSRLCSLPEVQAAIEAAMALRSARTRITADAVLREYARMAFSDIRQAVRWRRIEPEAEAKKPALYEIELVDSDALDDDAAASIAEVSQASGGLIKVKLHDKKAALDSLARHLGIFTERADAAALAAAATPRPGPSDELVERMASLPRETRDRLRKAIREVLGE